MGNSEWQNLKEAMAGGSGPAARKSAADAMRELLKSSQMKSNPVLVSLNKSGKYPTSIPLGQIPEQMEKNPQFFNLIRRIIEKGGE